MHIIKRKTAMGRYCLETEYKCKNDTLNFYMASGDTPSQIKSQLTSIMLYSLHAVF